MRNLWGQDVGIHVQALAVMMAMKWMSERGKEAAMFRRGVMKPFINGELGPVLDKYPGDAVHPDETDVSPSDRLEQTKGENYEQGRQNLGHDSRPEE